MNEIQETHDRLQRDVYTRMKDLRGLLDSIERRVTDNTYGLNDLGEIQGQACTLDCRIAALAVVRQLIRDGC